jgi:hypothetical protein
MEFLHWLWAWIRWTIAFTACGACSLSVDLVHLLDSLHLDFERELVCAYVCWPIYTFADRMYPRPYQEEAAERRR